MLFAHYDHAYVAPGERCPGRRDDQRPARPRRAGLPARPPVERLHDRRRHLLRRDQPGAQEAVRHPHGDARGRRPGPRGAGALGRDGRRRHDGRARRAPRRVPGHRARHRVAADPAPGLLPDRRAGPVDGGHAVPAVVEEDRAGDQRRQRQPAAGGAGEPVGLRRLTGVAAQRAARVRRRDRPGDRQLRRPDRVLRRLPLPRRRLRGVLRRAERQHGGDGGRGLLRLGARRRAGGRGRVHPRGQQADGAGPPRRASWRPRCRRPKASSRRTCGWSWPRCGARALGEAR